jgi:hypothetical protein
LPVFLSVAVCAAEVVPVTAEKTSVTGVSEAMGAGSVVPVPLSATVCGEPAALSATESVAAKLATEAGVKVTEIRQEPRAARDAPQLLVWLKLEGFVPPIVTPLIINAAPPGFERVTLWAVAVLPVAVLEKTSVVGDKTTRGAAAVIANVTGEAAPPPGAGFVTETGTDPMCAMSVAAIEAVSVVALTYVVVFELPLKVTTDAGMNPLPATVSVNAAEPAVTLDGCSEVTVGVRLLMVKVSALDVPPPGAGLVTVTGRVPAFIRSGPRMVAVTCVALTKVVDLGLPLKFTTAPLTKPEPFTESVRRCEPAEALAGCSEVIAGTGLLLAAMLKICAFDVPPPGAGLVTVTDGLAAFATSLARMAAVTFVALTKVVVRALPLKFTTAP